MPSLFPGMDPWLEGTVWSDFHTEFLGDLRAALRPRLRPRYVALIEHRVYVEREVPEQPASVFPDLTVARESTTPRPAQGNLGVEAPVTVRLAMPEIRREPFLTLRRPGGMEVVTVIELLSPSNKRPGSEGRREYLAKRDAVLQSRVHLVELDLLRGGERLPTAEPLPQAPYYITVSRAGCRPYADVWPIGLRSRLPTVFVPLDPEEQDLALNLQEVLDTVFQRADYADFIDYRQPPTPPLTADDQAWAEILTVRRE
ncbi:MAG TPA: DUF4058 family protein [Candidatus Xenobia bacterium]|jgi:hypothetical protein